MFKLPATSLKFLLLLILLVAADRLTKIFTMARPPSIEPFASPKIIELFHHRNFGIVANLPLPHLAIVIITIVVMALIIIGLIRAWRKNDTLKSITLLLILAGAIGNLWDRLQYGYVFDWFLIFGRTALNLADIFIALGVIGYILLPNIKEKAKKRDEDAELEKLLDI